MPTRLTDTEAIALARGDFGRAALEAVSHFAAPIFWIYADQSDQLLVNNGTAFFVDAGAGPFVVTANHVFQSARRATSQNRMRFCGLMPDSLDGQIRDALEFNFEERLIGYSSDHDIATFRMTSSELSQIRSNILSVWPPVIPQCSRGIVLAGYPGHERRLEANGILSFMVYPVLALATTVSDRQISCQFDREFCVQVSGFQTPPPNYETGGMSGGPVLTVIDHEGLQHWALGGVISEGSATFDLIYASRADCLRADGTIGYI
jgi:Trypsin-like peptidase domain